MIIIETKDGATLVNEKEMQLMYHNRDKQRVVVHRANGPLWRIHNVLSVTYASDMKEFRWREDSKTLSRMQEHILRQSEALSEAWDCSRRNRDRYLKLLEKYGLEEGDEEKEENKTLDYKVIVSSEESLKKSCADLVDTEDSEEDYENRYLEDDE